MAAILFLMGGELAVAILSVPLIAGLRIVLHVGAWLVLLMAWSVPAPTVLDGWETEAASAMVLAMGCGYAAFKRPNPFWAWSIGMWPDALRTRLRLLGGFAVLAAAFLAAGMLFDSSQLALRTTLVIGYLALARWLIRQAPKTEIDRRKTFVNVGIAASSAIVCGILFELAARVFIDAPALDSDINRVWTSHPTRLWTNAAGVAGEASYQTGENEWSNFSFAINGRGLRGPDVTNKDVDEFRILMIGDSFTFGWGMDEGRDLPSRLRRRLQEALPGRTVTVINGGVQGYGPWQEQDLLEQIGPALDPDLVLVQLFLGNDLDDTLSRTGLALEAYLPAEKERAVYWRNHRDWRMRTERWLRRRVHAYNVYRSMRPTGPGVAQWASRLRFVNALPGMNLPPPVKRNARLEALLNYRYPNLDRAWNELEEDVARTAAWCRERGIAMAVYVVPLGSYGEEWINQRTVSLMDDPRELRYVPNQDTATVKAFCAKRQIPYIQLGPALDKSPPGTNVFLPWDGHFSETGNEIAAAALSDWVVRDETRVR